MSASGITIRHLNTGEFGIFRRIRLEALRAEPSSFASSVEDWEVLSDEEWRRRLSDPVFVAFRDDQPVGVMGLLRQRSSKMAHRATLIMVYVRKDLRGVGLAKDLLDTVVTYALSEGIVQIELVVSSENPKAIGFYRREGFSEIGRIPGGVVHDGKEIDDIMMARRLNG
ncbi:GNAT family N-acetyltransferase [Rhizobium sp. ICMP 5592]|uniref:GNAT family N-acetyltransferase n=1 Tax=Rhizobium sp. ICMP 5592 TaxID=2292445 RepID=UPI0012959F78|nr:GNAT family N-acetyltransferase [Rhizobium sp. ICMP 5592]MQB41177.1 GNAT family N-acetyltransferase [Rhizobium sp. ICMP 5592]